MRHRVAFATMAAGCVMAGNALAFDATPVIYDLSALQEVQAPQLTTKPEQGLSLTNLPLSTPSQNSGHGDTWTSDGDLELRQPQRGPRVEPGAGSPPQNQDPEPNPTPNPEPGTMLLLGTALASGARYARQRRKA
jgi:hypothetical protein